MNIFFLHFNTSKCAKMHVNKHVVKMLIEHVQMLSAAHHLTGSSFKPPYKLTHKNHPCTIWTRKSLSNYLWLCDLTIQLCKEYTYRYGKIHKIEKEKYIQSLFENHPNIPDIGFTLPAQAMPVEYKTSDKITDIIEVMISYHHYYFFEKSKILEWKNRPIPDFIKNFQNNFEKTNNENENENKINDLFIQMIDNVNLFELKKFIYQKFKDE